MAILYQALTLPEQQFLLGMAWKPKNLILEILSIILLELKHVKH